ncbi:MAG: uroporphyrinogen decarboxylase family protein [bacterium]|nr:uroporphyrinogen decarboxylase family protein [bacterium]
MNSLTSRERLCYTLDGKPVDRVPISLYEFDGFYESWIHQEVEYQAILDYAHGKTDKLFAWVPDSALPQFGYSALDPEMIKTTCWVYQNSQFSKTVLQTPKGELVAQTRQDEGMHTRWVIEHYCKTAADAEKILSIPYFPWKPSVDSFFELDKKLGDTGIVLGDIPDPLCLTVDLFGFSTFLTFYIDIPQLIFRLLDFFHERIMQYLNYLLESGAVTLYRIYGPEYATPPYLSPADFDKLVMPYVSDMSHLMHRYGAKVRIHSHGKIQQVLSSLAKMNIDAIDPLEPPPDGNAEFAEVRRVLGNKVVLIGNIEERLFEVGTKQDIETAVKTAVEEGAKDGPFILSPTAMPLTTPLDKKIQENIIHYIDCGLRYGKT